MTKLLAGLLASLCVFTASAQSPVTTVGSIALSVGQWIVKNSKSVYYVRMEGTGNNETQARRAAFAGACEQAIGTVVLSEREAYKQNLAREDIYTYSSCYVEDYKVVSNSGNKVTVDVWVSDSRMANRLTSMGGSAGATINGEAIRKDYEKDQSKGRADRDGLTVIKAILNDYPRAAFTTKIDSTKLVRQYGQLSFDVTVEMKLSDAYVKALGEAIERYDESTWGTAYSSVRLYNGRFSSYSGRWRDAGVEKTFVDALSVEFNMELTFGGIRPVKQYVHNAQEQVTNQIIGYYNSNRKGDLVIDGNKRFYYTLRFEKPRDMSEDQFVDMITGFNTVDVRIIDNRRRSL